MWEGELLARAAAKPSGSWKRWNALKRYCFASTSDEFAVAIRTARPSQSGGGFPRRRCDEFRKGRRIARLCQAVAVNSFEARLGQASCR